MRVATQALFVVIVGVFTIWGFVGPAQDLRRRDALGTRALLVAYGQHIRRIPSALWEATRGAFAHPWSWDGPIFGWVLLVTVVLIGAVWTTVEVVLGDHRMTTTLSALGATTVGVGCGMQLVRDMADRVEGTKRRSRPWSD